MNLRFTLNEVILLEYMPDGWQGLELNIMRESVTKAIYTSYTSELTFHHDGWDALKYYLDASGLCARVPCRIDIDRNNTGNWKLLYKGVIDFSEKDFKPDYEKCEIKCRIKNDSYLSYIADRWQYNIWFFNKFTEVGTQTSFGGVPIEQEIARYTVLHNVVTGDQPGTDPLFPQISVSYRVIDALNYCLQYMTDNKVSVVSDFFTQQSFQKGITTIVFPGSFVPGVDQVDLSFKNCYGRIFNTTVVAGATDADTLDAIAKAFVQSGNFTPLINNHPTPATDNQKALAAYGLFDGSKYSWSQYDEGTLTIILHNVTPITDLSVELNGSPTPVITVEQELVYGMKNLFMAFNNELSYSINNGAIGNKILSFERFFNMLDDRFNLGMSLTETGDDTFQLRIEPKEYFYNFTEVITLGDIINVESEPNEELLDATISVGTKGSNAGAVKAASGKKQHWWVEGCQNSIADKDTDANYDIGNVGYQFPSSFDAYAIRYPDDVAFFLATDATVDEGKTIPTSPVLTEPFLYRVINSETPTIFNGAFEGTLIGFNAGVINYWAVRNHLFSLTGTPQTSSRSEFSGNYFVKNEDDRFSRKIYNFEGILTQDEALLLMLVPTGKIGYRTKNDSRSDSLYELTWNINTGKTKLKVFG